MSASTAAVTGAILGALSHLQIFIHGEWERYTPRVAAAYTFGMPLSLPATRALTSTSITSALALVSTFWTSYTVALFISIACYRYFFHSLRSFPGPVGAKLTGFWSMKTAIPRFKLFRKVQEAHASYGDFVRIRPREISINHVDAIRDIHGPGTVCVKGPLYDLNYPAHSLHMTRDKALHARRRRFWDRAFSKKALSEQEPLIYSHCKKLLSRFNEKEGNAVDLPRWLNFFSYDVIGDLAFGKSFDLIGTEGTHFIISHFHSIRPIVGSLTCVPWAFILFKSLPLVRSKVVEWRNYCASEIRERIKLGPNRKDLFTYLLGDITDQKAMQQEISGDLLFDTELAIVAGSDTTSTTLAAVLYLLTGHPEKQKLLQQELDQHLDGIDDLSHQSLVGLPMLEGCINEALRLYPAAPSGVQRLTPPEGTKIAGKWIPGDTLVSTPTFVIHRDSRYFVEPDSFIPERWFSEDLIIRKDAFSPFLTGLYSCVGRSLGLMELRMLVGVLLRTFNIRFSEQHHSEGGAGIFDQKEPGFRDYFTAAPPPYHVVLSKRS